MKTTAQSEYLKVKTLFIKTAANAFISDEILLAQWQALNYLQPPNYKAAMEEYQAFEAILKDSGAVITSFPANDKVTIDSIYCRDASIATDHGMIICAMGKAGRIKEPDAQRRVFEAQNIPVLGVIESPGTLEGGDVAWLDPTTIAVGHTYRTNQEGIRQLRNLLEPRGVTVIEVALPHYKGPSDVFHLMSILSPVDKDLAVVYSPLMPINFRKELLKRNYQLIEVDESEFDSMGCNVLAIAPRDCVLVQGNPKVEKALKEAGCTVRTYAGDHISVFGGGGPTCLTRPLLRSF